MYESVDQLLKSLKMILRVQRSYIYFMQGGELESKAYKLPIFTVLYVAVSSVFSLSIQLCNSVKD